MNNLFNWKSTEILITGGTGSLGRVITKKLITKYDYRGIRIYSRDEWKQWQMKKELNGVKRIAYIVGDVRNHKTLERAMKGVNLVINCAAMKQIPSCEANPLEAIQTNIGGAENVMMAALKNKVDKVIHISTDKAVYPINLYGVTKAAAEKLFIYGNVYSGGKNPKFSCCRYGNVLGSRGSVIPLWREQLEKKGEITITHPEMTRFWITLDKVSEFVLDCATEMRGGEIFVPYMPSMRMYDFAMATMGNVSMRDIGLRSGEKMHECLIAEEETKYMEDCGNRFILRPLLGEFNDVCKSYTSLNNDWWLSADELKVLLKEMLNANNV